MRGEDHFRTNNYEFKTFIYNNNDQLAWNYSLYKNISLFPLPIGRVINQHGYILEELMNTFKTNCPKYVLIII